MNFWDLSRSSDGVAIVDARRGTSWTVADLRTETDRIQNAFPVSGRKSFGLLLAENTPECIAAYLAAIRAGSAVILLDATLNEDLLSGFLTSYAPSWIFTTRPGLALPDYHNVFLGTSRLLVANQESDAEVHTDLGVLLSTSGSTGSPKLVRLSLSNVQANAQSIAQYLGLTSQHRPITSLPMAYSYGLSVINSHLLVGAPIIVTDSGVLQREFWDVFAGNQCTSLAGVPYTYQMLLRSGLLKRDLPSLRMLTQAGGRLDPRYIEQVHDIAVRQGWDFFVMYGQTEATARISYVPPGKLQTKFESIGIPIPRGKMFSDPETSELIYEGPNVMMGYAQNATDLSRGDELKGILRTGDLARQDDDGFFYITGRMKRFLKIFGQRFNLDDVEKMLANHVDSPLACLGKDDMLVVAVESSTINLDSICQMIGTTYSLHHSAIKTIAVDRFPRTANGKIDYQTLSEDLLP